MSEWEQENPAAVPDREETAESVWQGDEMSTGWGFRAKRCEACAGTGRCLMAAGEIKAPPRLNRRLRRARLRPCRACRGTGWLAS